MTGREAGLGQIGSPEGREGFGLGEGDSGGHQRRGGVRHLERGLIPLKRVTEQSPVQPSKRGFLARLRPDHRGLRGIDQASWHVGHRGVEQYRRLRRAVALGHPAHARAQRFDRGQAAVGRPDQHQDGQEDDQAGDQSPASQRRQTTPGEVADGPERTHVQLPAGRAATMIRARAPRPSRT